MDLDHVQTLDPEKRSYPPRSFPHQASTERQSCQARNTEVSCQHLPEIPLG